MSGLERISLAVAMIASILGFLSELGTDISTRGRSLPFVFVALFFLILGLLH